MRVLCCIDGTNGERISRAMVAFLKQEVSLAVLYVTDSGPQEEIERHRERFLRSPHPPPPRREHMRQAETASAQEILEEGSRLLGGAEQLWRRGHVEQIIVQIAMEWQADLLVMCSRSPSGPGPLHGPKSIGHVARFVLDHAPCSVLLVR